MDIDTVFEELGHTPEQRLKTMMARLRDPKTGCPWDIEQTFKTIAPYTIEEAYEVSDAIDKGDMKELKEELGDLLMQVVFHAQMADEDKAFNYDEVSDGLVRKMIARHPHVFGGSNDFDSEAQIVNWENLKEQERKEKNTGSILDGVAMALPALMRAEKLQKRAARVGFDWPEAKQVLDKINEESLEIVEAVENGEPQSRVHEEVGDLMFVVANLARKLGVDPEHALRDANQKFTNRFQYIENNAPKPMKDMELEEMEALWLEAKTRL